MAPPEHTKRILVAPLDWGLGHATRCIPVIRQLLQKNCQVVVAGDGKVKSLLLKEFPHLEFLHLPGYEVKYSSRPGLLPLTLLGQIPKILSAIHYENRWLKNVVTKHKINAVISDNRYGLYHAHIPTVFITHQLRIKAPAWAEGFIQQINYRYINKFGECWVPDYAGENNLSGELAHPEQLPNVPVHYMGPLSRFQVNYNAAALDEILVLLSGPEPQRTLFENIVLKELQNYSGPVTLVRGLPDDNIELKVAESISVYNHLPSAELQQKMHQAKLIISRCGYSTVMDIAALQKRSILIPTPAQTEQEYLAKHLMKKNFALCIPQNKFRLKPAMELANSFTYKLHAPQHGTPLSDVIDRWLEAL